MTSEQYKWGLKKLNEFSTEWGTTPLQTAKILSSREVLKFFEWVSADLFLKEYVFKNTHACSDCEHFFINPFDQQMCMKGKTATRVCKQFILWSPNNEN